jgi:branched-chain amino acid transport system ATP-binding protein
MEPTKLAGDDLLLEAGGVIAGYLPGINILNGCDLYANEGELVGIIGPNGAGKSTFPSLSIEENLQMGAYQAADQFNERFDFVTSLFPTLGARRKQRAGSLSGGERQMVAMGRALMMNPSVLLLDEPSAGLSPALQDEVFVRVREINRTGVTVIMVEQNARRCLQIVDRGYVLDQGRNAYTGTGKSLANDPKVIELYLGTLAANV